jgi:Flp pilus assembly protein TadG
VQGGDASLLNTTRHRGFTITMQVRAFLRHRHERRSRGQSLVELALILPIFLVLLSAALDLGRLAAARVTVANAAREGAFQAATEPSSYQAGQPCPTKDPVSLKVPSTNDVMCRTLLESKGSVISVAPANVSMNCSPNCSEALGNTVTVKVVGQFRLITPFMTLFFGGNTINFSSSSTQQIQAMPPVPSLIIPTASVVATAPLATASALPSPSPTVVPCGIPSAGFTATPTTGNSPLSVSVTDTSSSSPLCPITVWEWDWGDGSTKSYGKTVSPHVYTNPGPSTKNYALKLTVWNSPTTSNTSGASTIQVKP